MAKYQLRTFKDLIDKVCESLKIQASDTESRKRIRRNINTVYLDEVIPYKQWHWLRGERSVQTEPYFGLGTAAVTQNSVTVTLTQAPATSKAGHWFSTLDSGTYRILSHTAGSLTLVLESPFNEATAAAASYKIWNNAIPLPSDCKEIIEVTHDYLPKPLDPLSLQEFRRKEAKSRRLEGRPLYYTTSNLKDADPYAAISGLPAAVSRSSNGLVKTLTFAANVSAFIAEGDQIKVVTGGHYSYNVEAVVSTVSGTSISYLAPVAYQESTTNDVTLTVQSRIVEAYDEYRDLLVHPAIMDRRTILNIDFLRQAEAMEADSDEPLMPVEDRIVLYYGAMWLSCDRERNPEWGQENFQLFQRKLDRMAGRTEDSPDKLVFRPSQSYLAGKRRNRRGRGIGLIDVTSVMANGGGGSQSPTGPANTVAVFDSNGDLIGSSTISLAALEYLAGAEGGLEATLTNDTLLATVINSWSATTYKGAEILYNIQRGSTHETGRFVISTDGSNATYTTYGTSSSGDPGITFSADVSGGLIRWLYQSTNTGSSASVSYKVILL